MSLILRAVALSDLGRARENNEDAAHAGRALVAVADGIGGLPNGEVASDIAIEVLAGLDREPSPSPDALKNAVERANQRIRDAADADPALSGMGTTVTAMLLSNNRLTLVHVGDSRAYLLRDGVLTQLTKDDTYVQALVDRGAISAAEASVHPHRSLVTQAVQGQEISPSVTTLRPNPGDRFLLCSDGLSDVVANDALAEALRNHADLDECARRLIDQALEAGGPDNITVVIADVAQAPG